MDTDVENIDSEILEMIRVALDAKNLQQIRDILDTFEGSENPNIVKVELTTSQMRDMEAIRAQLQHPSLSATFRLMAESFIVGFAKGKADAMAGRART